MKTREMLKASRNTMFVTPSIDILLPTGKYYAPTSSEITHGWRHLDVLERLLHLSG